MPTGALQHYKTSGGVCFSSPERLWQAPELFGVYVAVGENSYYLVHRKFPQSGTCDPSMGAGGRAKARLPGARGRCRPSATRERFAEEAVDTLSDMWASRSALMTPEGRVGRLSHF